MESRVENKSWYLTVNGNKVEVTEEVYRAYRYENNRVHKKTRVESRCAQPDFSRCSGDCLSCPWHTAGILTSLEPCKANDFTELTTDEHMEDSVLNDLNIKRIYEQADCLVKDGAMILQRRFDEELSVREIAKQLGVSHTAINKRMRILFKYFKTNYEKFF